MTFLSFEPGQQIVPGIVFGVEGSGAEPGIIHQEELAFVFYQRGQTT
jgi:hypothetical protein